MDVSLSLSLSFVSAIFKLDNKTLSTKLLQLNSLNSPSITLFHSSLSLKNSLVVGSIYEYDW